VKLGGARLGVVIGVGVFLIGAAAEARPKPPPGSVIYVQRGALWRAPLASLWHPPHLARKAARKKKADKPEKPEKLVSSPILRRRVTRLEASGDGSALLVELGRNAAWIDLTGDKPSPPVYLPCRGRARLSPGGEMVLCASRTGNGTAIYRLRPERDASVLAGFDPSATALADLRGERVVTAERDALWMASINQPEQRMQVAPHVPSGPLSVAPDGKRAVGRYRDREGVDSLFGFRLDGQAARRKLGPGRPIAWSADSSWVAIQDQTTACAVRAVGGEYKCWNKFRPVAIDSTGGWLLLAKPPTGRRRLDLFLGMVAGPHPEKPVPLMRGVVAATLVP
jgi:hypothetical protein